VSTGRVECHDDSVSAEHVTLADLAMPLLILGAVVAPDAPGGKLARVGGLWLDLG
jgi:hypothetical protein